MKLSGEKNEVELWMENVIRNKKIKSVFQPIVSLKTGEIYGYEALSRITGDPYAVGIEDLFTYARKSKNLWRLEETCRVRALKKARELPAGKKLFLNADPNVINDKKFISGFTRKKIRKYEIESQNIIFEITEHSAIKDVKMFKQIVQHYQRQDYQIAIDDVGSGYSGLNRICALHPQFLKIDMSIVRNIHNDSVKQSLVQGMVQFGNAAGIDLIAEGIENEEEMEEVIRLGVHLGQGFFLGMPLEKFQEEKQIVRQQIVSMYRKHHPHNFSLSILGEVGYICSPKETTTPGKSGEVIYEFMRKNPNITEICIVDDQNYVLGMLTRKRVMELFGGRYGYTLHARDTAGELVTKDCLAVDASTSIEVTSKLAMARPRDMLYDAVVVTRDEKYMGIVTLKDLLETAINIQISRAVDANPLTGLPGNKKIEEVISGCICERQDFTAIYIDIDNFKAYNDAYGFNNGDLMLQALADVLRDTCEKDDFVGHIGGDDFVVIRRKDQAAKLCEELIAKFHAAILELYSPEDRKRGWIVSKDRNGLKAEFPLASLSVSVLISLERHVKSVDEFSRKIAEIKKKCKQKQGDCYMIKTI